MLDTSGERMRNVADCERNIAQMQVPPDPDSAGRSRVVSGARSDPPPPPADGTPQVGEVIRRLRTQRGLSLRQVAEASRLSVSFIGSVERGESDIAVGRLAQIANVFGHDVASLLGYSMQQARPRFIGPDERVHVERGPGVHFVATRIPGTTLEVIMATFEPRSSFDAVTHAGIDIMLVIEGELVLEYDGVDYALSESDVLVFPSSHSHAVRNDSHRRARAIGITTETIF